MGAENLSYALKEVEKLQILSLKIFKCTVGVEELEGTYRSKMAKFRDFIYNLVL
jgi:hypothetical protein